MSESTSVGSSAQDRPGPSIDPPITSHTACDACRRRKLKCHGGQPCARCVSSGITCTYGSGVSRTTSVAYIRHLEARIADLESSLRHPRATGLVDQPEAEGSAIRTGDEWIQTLVGPESDHIYLTSQNEPEAFHGRSGGLSLLSTVRDLCDQLAGISDSQHGKLLAQAFDSHPPDAPGSNRIAYFVPLPSKDALQNTIASALDYALACQEFVDRVDLGRQIERLYGCDPEDYTSDDRRALALVYALMALGRQHSMDDNPSDLGSDSKVLKGMSYFRASRAILDSMDCNHLDSIRTVICGVNYLLSVSLASEAYPLICIGMAAALRLGLHVYSPFVRQQFNAHELTQRRQVFSVLFYTQNYLSSVLGMPTILKNPDVEQTIAVPEEELYDRGKSLTEKHPMSPISVTILVCSLLKILAESAQNYLTNFTAEPEQNGSYRISYDKVSQWENALKEWQDSLPSISPDDMNMDQTKLRTQLLLRFVDAAVKMCVFRPFIHHVVRNSEDPDFSLKGFEFGSACLQASTQAIWLADTMDNHSFLINPPWYVTYALAVAASSLKLFVLGSTNDATLEDAEAAAYKAQEILEKLSRSNLSAKRCFDSLSALGANMTGSQNPPVSPRTLFMRAIGASED